MSASAQDTLSTVRVTAVDRSAGTLRTAPVQTIGKESFDVLGMDNVWEAVRSLAGVSIKDYGGIGGVKTVSLRSLGAQHTAVSYDGVAVSDLQSGQIDIGRFSLDNVDRVSVSIGQTDNIFQTARLFAGAGTLDIRTLAPRFEGKNTNVSATMKAGSFKTYNPSLLYEQKLGERWSMNATADYLNSDGTYPFKVQNVNQTESLTRENSDVSRVRTEMNVFGKAGRCGELNFKGNFLWGERGLPGPVILYNPTANERLWDRNFFATASYNTPVGDRWALKANLRYNYAWNRYIDVSQQYSGGMVDDRYTQREYYASAAARFSATARLHFTAAEDVAYTTLDATIPECVFPRRLSSFTALAGQFRSERLTATASLLLTAISETVSAGDPAPRRAHLSPAASVSYRLMRDKELRIRASFKDGFRVPTFNDLYYARVGNRNLKPERAKQFNLGLTWTGAFSASIDGFCNLVQDKIASIPTMFIWKTMNIGDVTIWGLDAAASGQIRLGSRQCLALSGNYSFHKADKVIPYDPENSGSATFSWINPWVNFSYILNAMDHRYSLPEAVERNYVDGFMDHSVSLGHEFHLKHSKIALRGEVLNLSGKNYAIVKNYPMPGRNYRLSIKITY